MVCAATGQIATAQPNTDAQVIAGQAAPTQPESSQVAPTQPAPTQPGESQATGVAAVVGGAHAVESTPGKRQLHQAESAYLSGARKLQHDDLDAAEREFVRALKLDPENRNYAVAISVTRQHRLTELVQRSSQARQAGDPQKAETLLAEARAIDPQNPLVVEHSGPFLAGSATGASALAVSGQGASAGQAGANTATPFADRTQMLAGNGVGAPWRIEVPSLASAVRLAPAGGVKSFHTRGNSADVLREVALAYDIRAIIDSSVDTKTLRFDLENVTYQQAMATVMSMAHVFAAPVDETSVMIARDDVANRGRLERLVEETIYVPGSTTEQINELANIVRSVFDVKQATVQTGLGSIMVRAPQNVLDPMNRTLRDLIDSTGEVMIEAKIYAVSTTRSINAGATIPTQFGVTNLAAAATQIVTSNQALVQQAIAQGFVKSTDSNITIALALLASGLVQSNLLNSLLGTFGGGILTTGVTETGGASFKLSLNTTDTRAFDDIQIRVDDRQPATFREGTRYPITSSTYSSGLSTAASSLSNKSINGVNIASLLQQFAGGTSATIPQITYEDLGVTLKATPVIQNTGRINLLLDLKIEALGGGSANGIPVLVNRHFASDLTVADGESALLVSNVSKSETAAMTGIPGLSELPGFQAPLQGNVEKDSSQLIVVVTPHIVRRRPDLVAGPRIPLQTTQ